MKRTLWGGSPSTAARPRASSDGDWKVPRQVTLCSSGFHWLMTPKFSMGLAPTRFQRKLCVKTWSASSKAWSTSPHVKTRCAMTFVPRSSLTSGLSGSMALTASTTASSGS